ncbi:hypothetical protein F5X98DRAFT_384742 [Xylaria grammica]|nr:hypothetical protein F5X98DRAFT_384742 [Xylaria grammica]
MGHRQRLETYIIIVSLLEKSNWISEKTYGIDLGMIDTTLPWELLKACNLDVYNTLSGEFKLVILLNLPNSCVNTRTISTQDHLPPHTHTLLSNKPKPRAASHAKIPKMPLDNNDNKGVTGAAKFVTSTLGNAAGGVGRTVGNVTGAAGRGIGDTITSATGSAGKPVGDAISSVGTGVENGANSVSKGVENAGQWKS